MGKDEKSHLLSANSLQTVGMPPVLFLFTLDQIATQLNIEQDSLMRTYLYYEGRSRGIMQRHMMRTVNIAPEEQDPDWRVTAREYVRWLKRMGFRTYDITTFG